MKNRTITGLLLAGALTLGLTPVWSQAATADDFRRDLTAQWESGLLLENGELLLPWGYDGQRYRLVGAERSDGSKASVIYTTWGDLSKTVIRTPAGEKTVTWQYDNSGREVKRVETVTGQGGNAVSTTTVTSAYDNAGRLASQQVNADGDLRDRKLTYDSRGLLKEEREVHNGVSAITTYTYQDGYLSRKATWENGRSAVTDYVRQNGLPVSATTVYALDLPDGGVQVTGKDIFTATYRVDGRLLSKQVESYTGGGSRLSTDHYDWSYTLSDQLEREFYVWDRPEEQSRSDISSREWTLSYDGLGRLTSVDANGVTCTYVYDIEGNNTAVRLWSAGTEADNITFTYAPIPQPVRRPFTDVESGAFYEAPVTWAVEKNITAGVTDTLFQPDGPCTRAQIVTFLWRAMGQPNSTVETGFQDVEPGSYYQKAVAWAVEKKITAGVDANSFAPDRTCTRAEVLTFLHRALGSPVSAQTAPAFSDVEGTAYYFQPIQWAAEMKVASGVSAGLFGPADPCTRAQVVSFLYRALSK